MMINEQHDFTTVVDIIIINSSVKKYQPKNDLYILCYQTCLIKKNWGGSERRNINIFYFHLGRKVIFGGKININFGFFYVWHTQHYSYHEQLCCIYSLMLELFSSEQFVWVAVDYSNIHVSWTNSMHWSNILKKSTEYEIAILHKIHHLVTKRLWDWDGHHGHGM